MEFIAGPAVHRVLCADCGTPIVPNSANLCVACLRNTVDITEGIPKQASVSFCRNCERFLSPPTSWSLAKPESAELLSICLKKLKGLNKVRLTEAHFIWTEPHSKRLRVSMTIQKEYLVQHGQCPDCAKLAAKNTWKALVQVRQKVPHKRTFLYLEQLILKHNAQKDTISIKEVRDGLDFFYSQKSHALKMVEFLASVAPIKSKSSEQLLTANFKYTFSVEIVPICKDDLVCIPLKQARTLSNINPLTVCTRVGNSLQLLDPQTLQTCDIPSQIYWRAPFDSLASVTDLLDHSRTRVALAGAFTSSGTMATMIAWTTNPRASPTSIPHAHHLGSILQPGDTALGYFLTNANYNSDHLPTAAGADTGYHPREEDKKVEQDYELFLRDLEEDPELRAGINCPTRKSKKKAQFAMEVDEAAVPETVEVLRSNAVGNPEDEENEEEEPDFPDVKLDELLEGFDELTLGGDHGEDGEHQETIRDIYQFVSYSEILQKFSDISALS
ncbi:NMD3 family-domain-containing protein [Pholiota molesta]|nr:NMD3 family-domain-containing protein [Pholiota molesta]